MSQETVIMDIYGQPQTELFRVEDLFNFPNEEIFSPNSTTTSTTNSTTDSDLALHHQNHNPYSYDYNNASDYFNDFNNSNNFSFTDKLGVPSEDVAELEWLSNFVDDSSSEFPPNSFAGATSFRPATSACTKPSRQSTPATWTSNNKSSNINSTIRRRDSSIIRDSADVERRCTHCGSEKTPQWRSGPLGPKTLCNACGVRYKSGRLVPEYRPAASPTFVLTQHSNSHRKVMELRRQKEMQVAAAQAPPPPQQEEYYGMRHSQVC
ncbi:hypothetical protein Leryth_014881 [Lithospermum erythrorhizon]|nr:hypothetical protein Leryth_014881 [Lithospermum erythrorhizon]